MVPTNVTAMSRSSCRAAQHTLALLAVTVAPKQHSNDNSTLEGPEALPLLCSFVALIFNQQPINCTASVISRLRACAARPRALSWQRP